MDRDGEDFEVRIVGRKSRRVERREFDVMVDEGDKAAAQTPTPHSVASQKGEVREARISRRRTELRLLDAGNADIVTVEEDFELFLRSVDAVGVELK